MNELALFAGAGGGILASQIIGANTVCAVEWDAYATGVLIQRQNDGLLPAFPIWDDVSTFDGKPWRGIVDLVSGGFPCQDVSVAGGGAGIDGARSGLWKQMLRVVGEIRPRLVFMENSPMLIKRGLAVVIGDLAEIGYDMQWICLSAAECGAHHKRDRFWALAYPDEIGRNWGPWNSREDGRIESEDSRKDVAYPSCMHEQGQLAGGADQKVWAGQNKGQIGPCGNGFEQWPVEPGMGRVANGVANRMDRLKCLGNGQVPRVAVAAFEILMARISNAPAA